MNCLLRLIGLEGQVVFTDYNFRTCHRMIKNPYLNWYVVAETCTG